MVIKNKLLLCSAICSTMLSFVLNAKEIEMNTAQLQAMDKITGRVSVIDIPVNGEVNFGSFSIVVRGCKTTPPEETPENYAFVDVADTLQDGQQVNIFKGWMLSSTPALNAIEHPIYDVWLLKCQNGEIDKNLLLSPEELLDREGMVKQSELKAHEEAKKEIIEPQASTTPAAIVEPEIADTQQLVQEVISEENKLEYPTTDVAAESEVIPTEVAIETAPVENASVEGGPTSLLNLPTAEEKPDVAKAAPETPAELTIPQVEQINEPVVEDLSSTLTVETDIIPTSTESLPIVDALMEEPALLTEPETAPTSEIETSTTEDEVVEEDQFIDLSSEAEAINALTPELNVDALVTE